MTFSANPTKLSIEDVRKAMTYLYDEPPQNIKPSVFERIMNKLGWHRQCKVYILDISKLKYNYVHSDIKIK
jgi:hypothetical protein